MKWDIPEATWRTLGPQLRAEWPDLTPQDIQAIAGKKERLVEKIAALYGWDRDEAERQVDEWTDDTLED